MNLRDYLHTERIKGAALARLLDIHPVYLYALKNGRMQPGYKLAKRIEMVTGGKVTIDDLMGVINDKKT